MKVLNLYAGIGGNRKLWSGDIQVTAVEIEPKIAAVYHDLYPDDELIIGDAHQYLLDHFGEFDFIWTSPPCQSHSKMRQNVCVRLHGSRPGYPDMRLYQEIIFLQYNARCRWVVENVDPYYGELIRASMIRRHLFWSNFPLPMNDGECIETIREDQVPDLEEKFGFDLSRYKLPGKRQVLRNCVDPELGRMIFDAAMSGAVQRRIMDYGEKVLAEGAR